MPNGAVRDAEKTDGRNKQVAGMKKKKPIVLEELSAEELVKYEIAKELGLFDRVMTNGWGSLSAKETGRIGGILAKRRKKEKQEAKDKDSLQISEGM